ncbi:MAG: N(4)-(beta-N-acetylglucosaminyl)-L-asparaginase [Bacteroidetes bacterium]|nr:N(4)-(beta-N-acetylglucosaminyl)-L-asparaginase [Bacteroidota bacterium]MDA1120276.1 N(4)-(beta-N-acetylglucosaminyl)-L-asparaginase [Bacteroidota bacterium]
MQRRDFVKSTGAFALGGTTILGCREKSAEASGFQAGDNPKRSIVISTWNNIEANNAAWKVLSKGGNATDSVEAGVQIPEGDPNDQSVGYGGRPDREGKVTLDASIMNHAGECGAVAFLEGIKHPIKVARLVMEKTPHVLMVGEGALQFAVEKGFRVEELLTPESENEWKKWLVEAQYKPEINIENHDTIGMVALDSNGNLGGACTTSGLAWKMRGRVGDSPIIGAGLFVDGDVGAATATGVGEAVIKIAGSHLVVEFMRQGNSPEDACKLAVERIMKKVPNHADLQVGFIALNLNGEYGGYAIQRGFIYAVQTDSESIIKDSKYFLG